MTAFEYYPGHAVRIVLVWDPERQEYVGVVTHAEGCAGCTSPAEEAVPELFWG